MKFKILSIILIAVVLVFVSGITGYYVLTKSDNDKEQFLVTKVIDGDTIELENKEKVRLLGINAPEENEHYYQESKNRLNELIGNKSIKLEPGPEDKDRYGRLLRYVFVDDIFVNLQLIKEGYATVYILNPDEKYYLDFKQAEKEAKENKLGLWNVSIQSNCIVILDFNYDAAGNDNENLNGEYVKFKNKCGSQVNLNKWSVKDEGTSIYTFKMFVLKDGSEFTLFSGKGSDTEKELYWSSKRSIWNNNGDTLFLRNDRGNLVLSYSYP